MHSDVFNAVVAVAVVVAHVVVPTHSNQGATDMLMPAELEALVAPGINHSLLSCGSLVRKGWRVEFFDNRRSVSHAGLGGCSLVELCWLDLQS